MRPQPPWGEAEFAAARRLIELGLEEDGARDDITTRIAIDEGVMACGVLRSRQPGVVAGLPCVALTLDALGADLTVELQLEDGDEVELGTGVAAVSGALASLLAAERTFLNLVSVLSGTATLTSRYVQAAGEACAVYDTRKTWPGYRILQKYAVRCGGGQNHRMGLSDAVLIKDNHRGGGRRIEDMVERARREYPRARLIVETDDIPQVERALHLPVDRILLDNFEPMAVRVAYRLRESAGSTAKFEVSGGITPGMAKEFADAGADIVSVGALTHSAPGLDIGLDLE